MNLIFKIPIIRDLSMALICFKLRMKNKYILAFLLDKCTFMKIILSIKKT